MLVVVDPKLFIIVMLEFFFFLPEFDFRKEVTQLSEI